MHRELSKKIQEYQSIRISRILFRIHSFKLSFCGFNTLPKCTHHFENETCVGQKSNSLNIPHDATKVFLAGCLNKIEIFFLQYEFIFYENVFDWKHFITWKVAEINSVKYRRRNKIDIFLRKMLWQHLGKTDLLP